MWRLIRAGGLAQPAAAMGGDAVRLRCRFTTPADVVPVHDGDGAGDELSRGVRVRGGVTLRYRRASSSSDFTSLSRLDRRGRAGWSAT